MSIYKAEGIVCSSIKLNEADRIVHIYTTNGLVRAVVKGIRKTKSKFGGRLEPISHVSLVLYSGRSLDTISQAELVAPYTDIKKDFIKLTLGLIMADFVQRLAEHESHPGELFEIFKDSLDKINNGNFAENIFLLFNLKLLKILGYNLEFDICVYCGSKNKLVSFSSVQGGMVCENCNPDELVSEENYLAAKALASIADGSNHASVQRDIMKAAVRLIYNFVKYHLDINLKSSHFLDRILMN